VEWRCPGTRGVGDIPSFGDNFVVAPAAAAPAARGWLRRSARCSSRRRTPPAALPCAPLPCPARSGAGRRQRLVLWRRAGRGGVSFPLHFYRAVLSSFPFCSFGVVQSRRFHVGPRPLIGSRPSPPSLESGGAALVPEPEAKSYPMKPEQTIKSTEQVVNSPDQVVNTLCTVQ